MVKKLIALVLALVCTTAFCSCGWNSKQVVAAVISENVTKIDITHHIGGKTTSWSIEETEIDTLREWFDKLTYKLIEVKDGQTPGDNDGNEVYNFTFTGGEWTGFSYVINGENDCYILNPEGNWFSVTNPSTPPVADERSPIEENLKYYSVLSVSEGYKYSDEWTVESEFMLTFNVGETIVALVTATDTEYITIEITDAGNTNLEVGGNYTISVSDKVPSLGEGDYIRVVCNPSAVRRTDIPHLAVVFSVDKTDKTGLSTAD